jgi:Fe2+ transport system protein FeoA
VKVFERRDRNGIARLREFGIHPGTDATNWSITVSPDPIIINEINKIRYPNQFGLGRIDLSNRGKINP